VKLYLFILMVAFSAFAYGQDIDSTINKKPATQTYQITDELQYVYPRPKLFGFITNIPKNYLNIGKESVKKENFKWLGLTAAATLILLPADESLLDATTNIRSLGVTRKHEYHILWDKVDVPTNLSAGMYHLGHGNTSLLVSGGFLLTGAITKDYRAIHTSSEILEGILTLGVLTQGLKRVIGRESPELATQPRGKWSGFPGWNEYMQHTASYDAMPSGHVATLTSTITVLGKNYPEVKWIRPVGYTLIGILGLEMMNSRVHWGSDYPLGFLIGYAAGTVAANSKITKVKTDKFSKDSFGFTPQLIIRRSYYGDNLIGVGFTF
jgi:membrane-associated phospholipid phosphatase